MKYYNGSHYICNDEMVKKFENKGIIDAFVMQYEAKWVRNYISNCEIHGETKFSGMYRECVKCRRNRLQRMKRQENEEKEMKKNNTFCYIHGIKMDNNGKCPECERIYNESGFRL